MEEGSDEAPTTTKLQTFGPFLDHFWTIFGQFLDLPIDIVQSNPLLERARPWCPFRVITSCLSCRCLLHVATPFVQQTIWFVAVGNAGSLGREMAIGF